MPTPKRITLYGGPATLDRDALADRIRRALAQRNYFRRRVAEGCEEPCAVLALAADYHADALALRKQAKR